jgi:uncharacterized protein (UPF0128 family)
MSAKKFFFYLLAVLLGGCVPVVSLHPLFGEKDVVFDEKLLGTWVDDPNSPEATWEFKRADTNDNAYRLIFSDKEGKKGMFVAHLGKLKDKLFLDICPAPWEQQDPNKIEWVYNTLFLIPAHTFVKIDSIEPQLKMLLTDDDKMKEFLKADPNAVKHEFLEDSPILTGSTKELQTFVLKYADGDKVFVKDITLNRKKAAQPNAPAGPKPGKTSK